MSVDPTSSVNETFEAPEVILYLTGFVNFEQEIHSLETQFDVIKYCIGITSFIFYLPYSISVQTRISIWSTRICW
jgi:hypothetical protein